MRTLKDQDDDGFYDDLLERHPEKWEIMLLGARLLTWLIVIAGLALLVTVAVARAQDVPAPPTPPLVLPSAPIPPERQPRDAVVYGVIYPAGVVDMIAMQQSHGWRDQLLKNSLPRPCADCVTIKYEITGMVNGVIAPRSPSQIPPYLSGWVHKDARFVVLKIDNTAQYNIVPTDVVPPIIRQWKWDIPAFYDDGKEHTVCTRVFKRHADYPRVTTLVDVGPLDNAKCPGGVAQYRFKR